MSSQATADGRMTLTITFALGTDLDNAQVQVQNRVAQALPRLPAGSAAHRRHHREGVARLHAWSCTWSRPTSATTCSTSSNYAHLQVQGRARAHRRRRRRAGVRRRRVQHARLARSRIELASRQLTATDVVRAIREQNVQVAAGVLGAPPAPTDTHVPAARSTRRAGSTTEERVRATSSSRATPTGRSRGCATSARVELGAEPLRAAQPARQQAGGRDRHLPAARASNALAGVDRRARDDGAARSRRFPRASTTASSTTRRSSCASRSSAVVETLFEAILLVVHRRAGVPADLARVDHPAGRRAGVADRHVRRDARRSASR